MSTEQRLTIVMLVCLMIFLFTLTDTAKAGQTICNQFPNGQTTCQIYNDQGVYQGQQYQQKIGNTVNVTQDSTLDSTY